MESLVVECLRCGSSREAKPPPLRQQGTDLAVPFGVRAGFARGPVSNPECPRCGYVGWAPVNALSERDRRALRERPLERRRLRLA
jgi:hypothetical protein